MVSLFTLIFFVSDVLAKKYNNKKINEKRIFNGMKSTILYKLCSARTLSQEFFYMPLFFTTYQKNGLEKMDEKGQRQK